jgi:DNA repair protein RadC
MVAREVCLSLKDTKIELPFVGKIKNSNEIYKIVDSIYDRDQIGYREHFYAIYLSNSNMMLGFNHIGIGGITSTVADLRIILQGALLLNAVGIVLAHNHPSGNLMPSDADIQLTKKINEACKIMDLRLIDHIILSEESYYSFSDSGLI